MAVRKAQRPPARPNSMQVTLVDGDPAMVSQHVSRAVAGIAQLERTNVPRFTTTIDLPVGATRINHGLGRKPVGMTVTPTVVDVTWDWAMTAADTKTVTVTTVGIAQPGAGIEVF